MNKNLVGALVLSGVAVVGGVVLACTGASRGRFGNSSGGGKLIAVSKDRYRATASERRLYGGNTKTEFWVFRPEDRDEP